MTTTVLGAGYAGIMAANRLAGAGERTTLVTPHPWFIERIRLHRVASGQRESARVALSTLVHPDVEVVLDTAVRITDGDLELVSGARQPYETLIYAVGSGARRPSGAHSIATESAALDLRAELDTRSDAPVVIVGAGLTGIEVAGAMADAGRDVRIVTMGTPVGRGASALLTALRRRGVVVEVAGRPGRSSDLGDSAIVIDATGLAVPSLAADSGLPTLADGRLVVDERLTVPGHPRILGAGDAVFVDSARLGHLRQACATALPMGAHAADVVLARRSETSEQSFAMGYAMRCIDLGARRGRIQFVHPDDVDRPFAISGYLGGLVKEAVCRLTTAWLTQERDRAGRFSWPGAPSSVR